MKDLGAKQNVLKEIMELMDKKEGDSLKSHPKLMAAKVEVLKPDGKSETPAIDAMKKIKDASASPMDEKSSISGDSDVSHEDLQKLLAHFKGL